MKDGFIVYSTELSVYCRYKTVSQNKFYSTAYKRLKYTVALNDKERQYSNTLNLKKKKKRHVFWRITWSHVCTPVKRKSLSTLEALRRVRTSWLGWPATLLTMSAGWRWRGEGLFSGHG